MIYPEHERRIFGPYWNGILQVHADPIRVYRLLTLHCGGDFNRTLASTKSADLVEKNRAFDTLLAAAVEAFGLLPFHSETGEGLTEDKIVDLVNAYTGFLASKKAKGDSSPTSPAPTVSRGLPEELARLSIPPSPSGSTSPAFVSPGGSDREADRKAHPE